VVEVLTLQAVSRQGSWEPCYYFEALDLAVRGAGGNRQSSNKEADGEWRYWWPQ